MNVLALTLGQEGPWFAHPLMRWSLTTVYLLVLLLIATYGLHRYWLVYLFYRSRKRITRPRAHFDHLPNVTVQLPMYNEGNVACRIIDAACRLDYPLGKLQIQVLDDSTDETRQLTRRRVANWRAQGMDIQHHHRPERTGFKAGALADALKDARGEFIAIFDADFMPHADFLQQTIHYFTDQEVGMVQTRWDHLNRTDSLLTRSQAIFLDGHFVIEHTARNRALRWINFNGTAGVWRRRAIVDGGSWEHDTLTEDVDLSYRAQLAGWNFVFLPEVTCPAELPPEINAFKAQQHRWTKGSIQTALKLLPRVLLGRVPTRVKIEAFFHLTSPMVYLYVTLMTLLFFPTIYVNTVPFKDGSMAALVFGMSLFGLGTASAAAFYVASQRAQNRGLWSTVIQAPVLMSIGIGIALNNARGCIEALIGHQSPFVRTPKYNASTDPGAEAVPSNRASNPRAQARYLMGKHRLDVIPTPSIKVWMSVLEIGMGLYTLNCARLALTYNGTVVSLPFLLLFASGYLYVGLNSLQNQWLSRRGGRSAVPQPI